MLIKRLRQLRSLVWRLLLIQSIWKECCIVENRSNLFHKERGRLNYQTSGYVLHPKNGTWTWGKVKKKGSKYNSVAMVTDNLNWWLSTIKLSTLFLHLTFAVRIKLHLAARATSRVYSNSFKKKKNKLQMDLLFLTNCSKPVNLPASMI